MTICAVVLAGGRATRMGGRDKPLMMLNNRPMIAHVLDRLAPQVAAIAINANGETDRFAAFGLPVVRDPGDMDPYCGPLGGVLAGMDWAASGGARHLISAACDTPFLPQDLVQKLLQIGAPALAATQYAEKRVVHPTFGLWPVSLRDELRCFLREGHRRVRVFAEQHRAGYACWRDESLFLNINTPDDLKNASGRSMLAPDPPGSAALGCGRM